MLRRYRSLKKIVYAATILFATIVMYAGTSYNDYHQHKSTEWVLPTVGRNAYQVDAVLQEPLHRLPLGPFEEHSIPIVVETLQLQIPTFEDNDSADAGSPSNVVPANHNDPTPKPAASAPAVHPQVIATARPASAAPDSPPVMPPAHPLAAVHPPTNAAVHPPAGNPQPVNLLLAPAAAPETPLESAALPAATIDAHAADLRQGVPHSAASSDSLTPIHPANPSNGIVQATGVIKQQPLPNNSAAVHNPLSASVQQPPAPNQQQQPAVPNPPQQPPAPNQQQQPAAPNPPQQAPTKPLPDLNKTITEMEHRLNHTRYQCSKFKVPYQIDSEVYQLPQFNVSYCKIPKAGCTYWEQVISYLNKPPYQLSYLGVNMPFQISKFDIRYTSHFNLPRRDFKSPKDKAEIMTTNRVMFVRHPLERLWSCYLEKFYLIDFWTTTGIAMKTAGADVKCPKSITFREFIDFTLPLFNENWAPMSELCNPCEFEPHIIGRVETLREDTYYTLKKLNLDWIFKEHDKFSREENQMLDMTIYNYQIHSIHWYSFYHKCLTQKELAAKLWDVFRKVGYLSSHATLPDNLSDYNQTTIVKELKMQFRKFPLSRVSGRAQQLKIMRRDYDSLPKPTMAKILEKYAMDFQLFGYSTQLPTA